MNHWESFGCFFRSIQPLPSPCHFKKKEDLQPRTSSFPPGNIFSFTPQKKKRPKWIHFLPSSEAHLVRFANSHHLAIGMFLLVQTQRNRKCSNDLFSPQKKKGKMRTVFRNIFIDIKKVIQQLQNKRKTSHLHERSNLTKCETQKFPILTVKGKTQQNT